MADLNPQQAAAVRAVVSAILEACKEAGSLGASGGILYAALMHHGISFSQYTSLMGACVRTGRLEKRGECYHYIARG